ncbi:SCO family protein [Persicobacter sp. CCB-QB2]|uniref:SCO family protein n=1 Tax=Persicobacter sp. CCB-QB2 TaxID=1561025 RepID=UPI0006A99E50|nr:SCO family protein [Persicobacter sp. CCB-QB2]
MNKPSVFHFIFIGILAFTLFSCESTKKELPILGPRTTVENIVDGQSQTDTLYHKIGDFAFYNQDSVLLTNKDFEGKIYVADFFFTTCPTICPIMKTQMVRVYEEFKDEAQVKILSHTIDPEHDDVALLHKFAGQLGVEAPKWNFVTGEKSEIYRIGQESYMVSALEDPEAPGGFIHSGAFILVDQKGHIRGLYDGTKADQVDRLIRDIPKLMASTK